MANPDYEAVGKSRFNALIEDFKTAEKQHLVSGIRGLFDGAEGDQIRLKKGDALALANRLQAEGADWSRLNYVQDLESLTE